MCANYKGMRRDGIEEICCHILLVLERALGSNMKRRGINVSPSEIRDALNSMKVQKNY